MSVETVALILATLATLDAAFASFRDAAGRNPLLHKSRYYAQAFIRGAAIGLAATSLIFGVTYAVIAMATSPDQTIADLLAVGHRMIAVYGIYALVTLAALFVYASPRPEVSSLATVLVLGPFTMARPLIILAGAVFAVWPVPTMATVAVAGTAAALFLAMQRLIALLGLNPRDLERQIEMR